MMPPHRYQKGETVMMKKFLALAMTGIMALSLAACGGSSGSSDSSQGSGSGTASSNSLTINIWDSNQQAGLQQIVDEWSAESGISAKIEVIDWDNYWTLLEAGASGGTMPDVFWMHSNTAQMYMENDILLDLT
ncbi:MAG: extracellular solute-binding protein, partial [Sarcina sp.]|nr:extracellular solute-binding protein [Sarcina sp.]